MRAQTATGRGRGRRRVRKRARECEREKGRGSYIYLHLYIDYAAIKAHAICTNNSALGQSRFCLPFEAGRSKEKERVRGGEG